MSVTLLRFAAVGCSAIALSLASYSAHANLINNGSFEATTLTGKGTFQNNVTGWTGGAHLTYLDFPGTADNGTYLSVYPGFPATSSNGGNFIEADGDPNYSGAFSQIVSGLTVGHAYTLTFEQAAGQQAGFTGPTSERWSVTFGGDNQLSSKISLAQGATGPWQRQTMTFVATAVSETLTFLAVGTPGGAPPISFLDGVDLEAAAVPEPASYGLLGIALVGILAMCRTGRRQA